MIMIIPDSERINKILLMAKLGLIVHDIMLLSLS